MVLSGRIICSKPGIYADGVQFCIFVFKKIQYIMKHLVAILFMLAAMPSLLFSQDFKLGESGYFNCKGVDAMLFNDYYPEGHQGGVSIIMHGKRVATNGDIRFDETPGQWQPVPKKISSSVESGALVTKLAYPDSSRHATGFNPMFYPDVQLTYTVTLAPKGHGLEVVVDLDSTLRYSRAGCSANLI